MTEAKSYEDFLSDIAALMKEQMPATDRLLIQLEEAEAEKHRLVTQLAATEERIEVLRTRYQRDRALLLEMFGTWKSEYVKVSDERRASATLGAVVTPVAAGLASGNDGDMVADS